MTFKTIHLPRLSIGKRLAVIFIALILVGVSAIMGAEDSFDGHVELAQFVNMVGRLRMLSQSIAYNAHRYAHNEPTARIEVTRAIGEFEAVLDVVEAKASRFEVADEFTLEGVRKQSQKYIKTVNRLLLLSDSDRQTAADLLHRIETEARSMLYEEEEVMQLLLERYAKERRKLRHDLFGVLSLGLMVTAIAYWRIRKRIVEPVASMVDMARRIAAGELDARVRYDAKDELGELVVALNKTADTTQHLIARYREAERAMESTGEGIMISDARNAENTTTYVNPSFCRITGYTAEEVIGRNGRFFLGDDFDQPGIEELRQILREQRDGMVILRCYRKDGTLFWNELSVSPVRDDNACVTHTISIFKDITERKRQEEDLLNSAHHDALTGLANRTLLNDRLTQAITAAHRHGRQVGVLFVDLDNFKLVNDALGHDVGDLLLIETARRLGGCLREGDTVARLGGDEFVLLLTDMEHEDNVSFVADRVLAAMVSPFPHGGGELYVSASIGASFFPRDGEDSQTLLKHADIAMYRAKEHGHNNFQVFTPEMQSRIDHRLSMETQLRKALERDEFVLCYQPQVSLETGSIVGAEALIRWRHGKMGMVSPAAFIPLAEETGLIVPIGEWVLDTVCTQIKEWHDSSQRPIRVAVNLSARQFRQKNLVQIVEQCLRMHNVDASHLELEMTESMVMQDPGQTIRILSRLKDMGSRISLDDFGTGYSSLAYLRRFPIDVLKVDQSFIREITSSEDDAAIAASIIALAHSLQLSVIAEGVETQAQLHYLRRQRCDAIQGYYFGRPVPAEEFAAMVSAGKRLTDSLGVSPPTHQE